MSQSSFVSAAKKSFKGKKINFDRKSVPVTAMLSGLGIALAITCIVFIAYALLITYSSITEKNTSLVVIVTAIISVIVAGFDTAKSAKDKGWLWGMASGVAYALILFIVGAFIAKEFIFNSSTITMLFVSIAGGGLGGMIGINISNGK